MISVITMQSVDGDCPENITVDVNKLRAIPTEDSKYDDAQKYVALIEETADDGDPDNNPECSQCCFCDDKNFVDAEDFVRDLIDYL